MFAQFLQYSKTVDNWLYILFDRNVYMWLRTELRGFIMLSESVSHLTAMVGW